MLPTWSYYAAAFGRRIILWVLFLLGIIFIPFSDPITGLLDVFLIVLKLVCYAGIGYITGNIIGELWYRK